MDNNNDNIFENLINYIITEYWGRKEKMTLNTTLEKDLGITGTDGIEFLENFLIHFNIDYDKNREWQLHFNSESGGLIDFIAIFNWLRGKKDRVQYDLTLGHLVKVIKLGYWIDMKKE